MFPCATKLICYYKELYVSAIKYLGFFIMAVSLCHLSGTCSEYHRREIVLVYLIPIWIVSLDKSYFLYPVPFIRVSDNESALATIVTQSFSIRCLTTCLS